MTHIIANIYFSGPSDDVNSLFVKANDNRLTLNRAEKSRCNIFYINFPIFRFSLLNLSFELQEYINQFDQVLMIERPATIEHCILSVRSEWKQEESCFGFYFDSKLMKALAKFSLALDFDPDYIIYNEIPYWQL